MQRLRPDLTTAAPSYGTLAVVFAIDEDRAWGWSNDVYSLGCAFVGYGRSPEDAVAEAIAAPRDDLRGYAEVEQLPLGLVAIRADAQHHVTIDPTARAR